MCWYNIFLGLFCDILPCKNLLTPDGMHFSQRGKKILLQVLAGLFKLVWKGERDNQACQW